MSIPAPSVLAPYHRVLMGRAFARTFAGTIEFHPCRAFPEDIVIRVAGRDMLPEERAWLDGYRAAWENAGAVLDLGEGKVSL